MHFRAEHYLKLLHKSGAVQTDTHVVLSSGTHTSTFIDLGKLIPLPVMQLDWYGQLSHDIRAHKLHIDTVLGAGVDGAIIAQGIASKLSELFSQEINSIFAEKTEDGALFIRRKSFDSYLADKKVLVVDGVVMSGNSTKCTVDFARLHGADVIGVAAMISRGENGVCATAETLGAQKFIRLLDLDDLLQQYTAKQLASFQKNVPCPLCTARVPIKADHSVGIDMFDALTADGW